MSFCLAFKELWHNRGRFLLVAMVVALITTLVVFIAALAQGLTAYSSTPGYSAQQSTLNTQRYFTLLIGTLVLGGFFQIQTLQKVAQIGMLRAIGTSRFTVGLASMLQIITVNAIGVIIGATGALLLSLTFPPAVPITFTPTAVTAAVVSLMIIGPLGGLVSVWVLTRVEPLRAIGLAQ